MRNRFAILIIALALLLSSCQAQPKVQPDGEGAAPAPAETSAAGESTEPTLLALPSATAESQATSTLEPAGTEVNAVNEEETPPGCTVNSPNPTPGPTEQSIFPPVTEDDWSRGPEDAAVTIISYSDFQCPYCAQLVPVLDALLEKYPDDVRIAFRHLPLLGTPEEPFHDKAALGMQAAEAAGLQGKFWEMHDALFASQEEWASLTPDEFQAWLVDEAGKLDLDVEQFESDLSSEEIAAMPQEAWDQGQAVGMTYTPVVLLNWQLWPNSLPISLENLSAIVELEMLADRQFTNCPAMEVDASKQYIATLETEKGDIVIELYPEEAPLAVNNFVFLAGEGWYDGITFHRVLPGYIAQTGDPTGTGFGGPGYAFTDEITPDLTFDTAGVVAMANSGEDSNGSQFFITMAPTTNLDGGYTIFGHVIEGLDVVESLTARDPSAAVDLPPGDKLIRVTVEEK